mgnify:CR=1 FL=1
MVKDTYQVTLDIEREAFDPMTNEQWDLFKEKMDEQDFDNPFYSCVEIAMEIEATVREDK